MKLLDDDDVDERDEENDLPPILPPEAANAVLGSYISNNPSKTTAIAGFFKAFKALIIVLATTSNGFGRFSDLVMESELIDGFFLAEKKHLTLSLAEGPPWILMIPVNLEDGLVRVKLLGKGRG